MRTEKWKTLVALILACVLPVLSACSGQTQQEQGQQSQQEGQQTADEETDSEDDIVEENGEREVAFFSPDYAYRMEEIPMSEEVDIDSLEGVFFGKDRIISLQAYQDENGFISGPFVLVSVDMEGQDIRRNDVNIPVDDMLQTWCADEHGNLYCATTSFDMEAEPDEPDTYYTLYAADPDGKVLWSRELKPSGTDEESDYSVESLCAADKRLLVSDESGISVFSTEDGSLLKEIAPVKGLTDGRLYQSGTGRTILAGYRDGNITITEVLAAEGKTGESYDLPGGDRFIATYAGTGSDLLLTTANAVYSYDLGGEPAKIMDYIDSDLWFADMTGLTELKNEEKSLVMLLELADAEVHLVKFNHVEKKEEEPVLMTLGGYQVNDEIKQEILLFNEENEDVRISLLEYTELYPGAGAENLKKDVFSGKGPDILFLSTDMDSDPFLRKELLEDLQPMIEEDEEIAALSFLESAFLPYRQDDALLAVTPRFRVTSMAVSASEFESEEKVTLKELKKKIEASGTSYFEALGGTTRDAFLLYAMEMTGRKFVDSKAGKCTFDSDSFRELLSFAASIKDETEEEKDYSLSYRDGKAFLYYDNASDFEEYGYLTQTLFGTDVIFAGFPLDGTSRAVFSDQLPMGIDKSSPVKEEAWDFIRRFLTEEYQSTIQTGWPVGMEALKEAAENAQLPYYEEDENGKLVETEYYDQLGDTDILRKPLTAKETGDYLKWLESLSDSAYYDDNILRIIFSETDKLVAGKQTADECAAQIQEQVTEYLK